MKILVVCQYYYPEPFRLNDICETLVAEGHTVTVLTGLPNYPTGVINNEYRWGRKRRELINGVDVIRVSIIGRGQNLIKLSLNYLSFLINGSLRALFIKKDFDVVFVYQQSPITLAIPALVYRKFRGGQKVHLYCLDLWPESLAAANINFGSIPYKFLLKISRRIYKSVDSISVTSPFFRKYMKEVIGLEHTEDIVYMPQYAEDLYADLAEAPQKQIVEGHKVIDLVYAGNIGEIQNVECILLAASQLKEMPWIRWHIIGDGSGCDNIKHMAEYLKLEDTVTFYERQPASSMPEFYSMADALLVSLRDNEFISYTLPGKVQSYMISGKPIIGCINGEVQRVISDAKCGLCAPAEDYKALAGIVKDFSCMSQKDIDKFGENAKTYYDLYFNKKVFMTHILSILEKLINK